MAENSSSNVASVAIVILVILAIAAGIWFFTAGGGSEAADGPDIQVELGGGE